MTGDGFNVFGSSDENVLASIVPTGLPHLTMRYMPRAGALAPLWCFALRQSARYVGCRLPLYRRVSSLRMRLLRVERLRAGGAGVAGGAGGAVGSVSYVGRVLPATVAAEPTGYEGYADPDARSWLEAGGAVRVTPVCGNASGEGNPLQLREPALAGCVPSVVLGLSRIHGRGLFTTEPIAKGAPVFHLEGIAYVDGATALSLLESDVLIRRGVARYVLRCGGLLQYPDQAQPLHFANHSCAANVGCAAAHPHATSFLNKALLGRRLPPAAAGRDADADPGAAAGPGGGDPASAGPDAPFMDANTFIALRDIRAGEELTLNYRCRVAPFYPREFVGLSSRMDAACRCRSAACEGQLFSEAFLEHGLAPAAGASELVFPGTGPGAAAREGLQGGYDDEAVVLSMLADRGPLVRYMGNAYPGIDPWHAARVQRENAAIRARGSLQEIVAGGAAGAPPAPPVAAPPPGEERAISCVMERRRFLKRSLLAQLRAVVKQLDATEPTFLPPDFAESVSPATV